MEYIVILLLVGLVVTLYFKNPSSIHNYMIDAIVKQIKEAEPEIVMGVYNSLPSSVKEYVDSVVVASIVEHVIRIAVDVLEETKMNSK